MIDYLNYPNPNFVRKNITVFDSGWLFSLDNISWKNINVPFCPESKLSGIGYTGFIPVCYYKRKFTVPNIQDRIILNFGAVDYITNVYINGKFAFKHEGGYTPFSIDITDFVVSGENMLSLTVYDGENNFPFGKQSYKEHSFGCFYTRTSGIWQSVWIEYVPKNRITSFRVYPDAKDNKARIKVFVIGRGELNTDIFYKGELVCKYSTVADKESEFEILFSEKKLWDIGNGRLYDIKFSFCGDEVYSYFGLRDVCFNGYGFYLNGNKIFQKGILNQGYYKDGIYTAPNIETAEQDIDRAISLGFNCIRLHQKVFDPKFLYLCDKKGIMVWGEFPSWGIDFSETSSLNEFLTQWKDVLIRDFNHPSIVLWCPINEAWVDFFNRKPRNVEYIDKVYMFTKAFDTTRPCVDTSGGYHGHETDLYDFHCYEEPSKLLGYLKKFQDENVLDVPLLYTDDGLRYSGNIPVMLSEFGGFTFGVNDKNNYVNPVNDGVTTEEGWGYGEKVIDGDKFVARYKSFVEIIKKFDKLSGFCYTQLYDIEQEENGFFTYDRKAKLSSSQMEDIKRINNF